MTEPTVDDSDGRRGQSADAVGGNDAAGRGTANAGGDVAQPTPEPRTFAEALDVDPERDDVKG
jgi:hypothetical protein